ncbi:MAG: class I SAM-dependent methyltransferase [Terrimicrobiaceae bacterium]
MNWIAPGLVAELDAGGTTAHRICSAEEAWIERFGGTAVISIKQRDAADRLLGELDRWLERAEVSVPRIYLRHLVRQPRENDQPILLRGDAAASSRETVRESGLLYEVDFATGYSVGLFCDQRANRLHLRSLAPKRLLNTFSYTCAFSVAAAIEGAETLSIDLSKFSLTRGRRNFELNGLDAGTHRFLADDVLAVLPRLAGRGEKFDAIILDPPTFGRSSPRKAFRAARDYEDLIVQAVACASPGASILLSTNCSALSAEKLRSMGSRVARGKATFHREPPQPDFPIGHGSATVWMRLKG